MNRRYKIDLTALQPILIGEVQTSGNYRPSATYIPGKVWRGAVAAKLRRQGEFELFDQLFGEQTAGIRFGPLYLSNDEGSYLHDSPTCVSCKRNPGTPRKPEDKGHGVYDVLARQFAQDVSLNYAPRPNLVDEFRCPVCHKPMSAFERSRQGVRISTTTHVAINRTRHTAQPSQLYTREGVYSESQYTGYVDVPEELEDKAAELFRINEQFEVGANRSRGMGLTEIIRYEVDDTQDTASIQKRVNNLNTLIEDWLSAYHELTEVDYPEIAIAQAKQYFTVDLHESAVFHDGTQYTSDLVLDSAQKVYQWTQLEVDGGWHAAARLPRRTQMTTTGVYLFQFTDAVDVNWLQALQVEGVGLLRNRGYGQITICSEIHMQDV